MAGTRFYDQKIVLDDGTIVTGKNIRRASESLFRDSGGSNPAKTVGIARVNAREIPVRRHRGRSQWEQAGGGYFYSAHNHYRV